MTIPPLVLLCTFLRLLILFYDLGTEEGELRRARYHEPLDQLQKVSDKTKIYEDLRKKIEKNRVKKFADDVKDEEKGKLGVCIKKRVINLLLSFEDEGELVCTPPDCHQSSVPHQGNGQVPVKPGSKIGAGASFPVFVLDLIFSSTSSLLRKKCGNPKAPPFDEVYLPHRVFIISHANVMTHRLIEKSRAIVLRSLISMFGQCATRRPLSLLLPCPTIICIHSQAAESHEQYCG
ncbi:hypothetical protein DFH28DRAFT_932276 [Melampsora americana]|nr:hypothetical protein DFH28DRAFT_932276 [Melampsora americana]